MEDSLRVKIKHLILFFFFILLSFLSACNGAPQDPPIINYFNTDDTAITEEESATLSWAVTNATIVTINQNIGDVDSSLGTPRMFLQQRPPPIP